MPTLEVKLEVEIPDVEVSQQDIDDFVSHRIAEVGSIHIENPLFDCDYEITDIEWEEV